MRRRQFQPNANVPMVTETHRRLALELRMAGETLIGAPSPETYNQMSKILAALSRAGLAPDLLEPATATLNVICDRYERVGKVGVSDVEAQELRAALARLDGRMASLPLNKLQQAIAQVDIFCATVGA